MDISEIKPHQDRVLKGMISATIAFFLLAVMNAMVKLLGLNHHVAEIAFYRNLIPMIGIIAYILLSRKKHLFHTARPGAVLLRVLFGTTGLFLTFSAVKALPMADATVLFFASTLLIPVLSFFLLKEHIGPHRWAAIIIGLSGVILMARPTGEVMAYGVMLALGAAFFHAVIQIFLRHLKTEDSLTVTFYFMLGGTIIAGIFMPWVATTPTLHEWLLFLGVGISGGLAQYFLTSSFRLAPASVVAPFNYTGLIWASLFDIIIWHHVPGWSVFAGGGIIIVSKLYIIHRERLAGKKKLLQL